MTQNENTSEMENGLKSGMIIERSNCGNPH